MSLKAITREDVQRIIDLAQRAPRDPNGPKVISASDITPEEMAADSEQKSRVMKAIDDLGDEGRAEIGALMLLGRNTPETDDFELLKDHSRNSSSDYIAAKSPLSDYLAKGLAKLGV